MEYRSVNRALKRGNLRVASRPAFTGNHDSHGLPVFQEIPFLERKTKRNGRKYVFYSKL